MNKTDELRELMIKHPDREVIFMYPDEGSEWGYTMGTIKRIFVDEYNVYDDRVCLKSEDDYIYETLYDEVGDELFSHSHKLSEIDEAKIEWMVEERMKNIKWKKAIIVYIGY